MSMIPMRRGAPVIEALGIVKRFGSLTVLDGLSLTVREREVVVLIGPSGSGKTTFLRCINLLVPPDAGRIVVAGSVVAEVGEGVQGVRLSEREINRHRSQLGMVFQHFNLFPHLSVLDNITVAPRVVAGVSRDEAEDRARRLLARVGLAEKASALPATLSGGQKQRVAIVRALAMQPKVMLFDEPTSALDPETVGEVLAVMRQLASDGMTMIVASHEMSFAREVADHVVFMEHGRVVEEGRPQEILVDPDSDRLRRFIRRLSGVDVPEVDGVAALGDEIAQAGRGRK